MSRPFSTMVVATSTSASSRSEEHTSELQSRLHLVCRLLLEKKNRSSYVRRPRLRLLAPVAVRPLPRSAAAPVPPPVPPIVPLLCPPSRRRAARAPPRRRHAA